MKFFYLLIVTIISLFFLIKRKDSNTNIGALSGEWIVENADETNYNVSNIGNIYYFYGDSIRIFDNEYKYGTYEVNDSVLSYQINGYPIKSWIFNKNSNKLQLYSPQENVHYNLTAYNKFEFMTFILLFLVGIISIAVLVSVFESFNVWIVSSSWIKLTAKAISTKINVRKHEKYQNHSQLSDYQFKEVERGPLGFGYKITSKYYSPYVNCEYQINGKNYNSDNSVLYNHCTYTEKESNLWIEEWKKNGVPLRVNPNNPTQVFFGWKHFSFIWTFLLFVVFTLISVSFFASLEMILNIFNLEFKRIDGRISILVFIIPIVFLIYFTISIIKNLFIKRSN